MDMLWNKERRAAGEKGGARDSRQNRCRAGWRISCRSFYLFFAYTILIWCCELTDLFCWILKLPQQTLLSRAAALLLAGGILWKAVGPVSAEKTERPDWCFVLGSVILGGFFAVKSIRPDMSYDTQNYHLLSQLPGFVDNLHFHVMPGRFQMFGFRLGDRMFYPFRALLGLRMGTLLNAVSILLIYRQITVFLAWFKKGLPPLHPWLEAFAGKPSVLAFLITCRLELLQESGTYMVELVALPFFLEMVFLLVRENEEQRLRREAVVFCLLGGLMFALKMTNIVYLAPMVLLYIWKIRKSITPSLFAGCLAAGAVPVLVYLIYNELSTGNPIFPYYDLIFQSPYYPDNNFKDIRWGPQSRREIFLWPYYMIRYPEYHFSEIYSDYNLDLAVIYLAVIGLAAAAFISKCRKQKKDYRKDTVLLVLFATSLVLWIVTTGHTRYYVAGVLLGGIAAACGYLRLLQTGRKIAAAAGIVLAVIFALRVPSGLRAVWVGQEWALRDAFLPNYQENLPYVFRDRELFPERLKQKVDVFFLTWGDYGSYARLIGEDVPVYNRFSIVTELADLPDNTYLDEIESFMREGKGVYDLIPQGYETLKTYLETLNGLGYYVSDLDYLDTILTGAQAYTAAGLQMADGRENACYLAPVDPAEAPEERLTFQKESDSYYLDAIAGDPEYWLLAFPFDIAVIAEDGENQKEAGVLAVGGAEYQRTGTVLDLTGLDGEITLHFQSRQEGKRGIVVNPQLCEP